MVKGKKGLGKGLDSLIEDYGVPQEIEKAEHPDVYLKISQVEPNRKQPRKNFDENGIYGSAMWYNYQTRLQV